MPETATLPDDVEVLKGLVLERNRALEIAEALCLHQKLELEKLRFQIAVLKREQYGRSSEARDRELVQMQLSIEDLAASLAEHPPEVRPAPKDPVEKPVRQALPPHLPREEIVHGSPCSCPACGGTMRPLGEDVSEMLEYVPQHFKVIRHVRPKFSCAQCQKITQAAAPSRPIARGLAGPGLLAHVLVSKYLDHLPLYRQSQIYQRDEVDLSTSTLCDWVGESSALLRPLVAAVGRYVLGAQKIHGDDTPVPVLCPGRKTTKQGRLWTYVRDDRPAGSTEAPAVWFQYSPDRKGERPQAHLASFSGILQADAYAGFERLYGERIQEAACWAHARRNFYEIHAAMGSPIAAEALERIGRLYGIEAEIRGRPPSERAHVRQARAGPELESLHSWLGSVLPTLSKKSELATAIRYMLSRWAALTRFRDDGRVEIDNNTAERALRCVALGRNYVRLRIMRGSAAAQDSGLGFRSMTRGIIDQVAAHNTRCSSPGIPRHEESCHAPPPSVSRDPCSCVARCQRAEHALGRLRSASAGTGIPQVHRFALPRRRCSFCALDDSTQGATA